MGQYHILVNLDKREFVDPHALGLGLKQMEHLSTSQFQQVASLSDALYFLVMTSPDRGGGDFEQTAISGQWAGDRCVILGDYTDDSDLPYYIGAGSLYEQISENAHGEWVDISEVVAEALGDVFGFRMEGDGWKRRVFRTVAIA